MKSAIIAILAAVLMSGCATSSHVITGQPRPAIPVSEVKLYRTAPANYKEIAIVRASSRDSLAMGDQAKLDKAIARLKAEAARLGANGIVIKSTRDSYGGSISIGTGTGTIHGNTGIGLGTAVSAPMKSTEVSGLAIYVPSD